MATISSDVTANVQYTLSESGPPGYAASQYSCEVTDADGNVLPAVVSNTITLNEGESAVCTITNDDESPDGFEVSNDGINYAVNPSVFTATGDDLFVKITDTSVDFTDLKKVEAELKDADRNKIKTQYIF